MPPGKLAAQAGHAFLDSFLQSTPDLQNAYRAPGHGTKVTLTSTGLEDLLWAECQCRLDSIPCVLITDSGHVLPPHFTGDPIITAMGFGPARRDEVRHITKRFALVV